MMTEDEAKTKWCPMARGQNWDDRRSEDGSFTANRLQSGDPLAACLCLGSRCMMWRWGRGEYEFAMTKDDTSDPGAFRFVSPEGDGWERVMSGMLAENVVGWARKQFPDLVPGLTAWRRLIRGNGYCGLAGEVSP